MGRASLGIFVSGHVNRLECGRCFYCNGLEYMHYTVFFTGVRVSPCGTVVGCSQV